MEKARIITNKPLEILYGVTILFVLYLASLYNYLLFHSLAEIFGIFVACGIFIVAWNSRKFLENNYLLFLGIAYLFIGVVDLSHLLGYNGLNVFKGYDTNMPTQLWIAARYLESISLLLAPLFFRCKLKTNLAILSYTVVTVLILFSIFYWKIFPTCFVEGSGLTSFKKISEYIISLILLGSIAFLFQNRKEFDTAVFRLLIASVTITICSELAFTYYMHAYGLSNLIGHFLKIISFYLIYKAIIETGFVKPYGLLFRNLKKSEESLLRVQEELEERVKARTAELRRISLQLLNAQEEERKRIALELHDDLGQTLSAIKFRVENCLQEIDGKMTQNNHKSLEPIVPMVQRAVEDVRRIQKNLRPSSLDDLGILPTISWFCREFETTYSEIIIKKDMDIEESDVPEPLKIVIYRIIQEALNNIAKHSGADSMLLSLKKTDSRIEMVINDNGVGFDLDPITTLDHTHKGLGLSSMKERTELSGGSYSIESIKGSGTTVKSSWKFNE